MSPLMLLFLRKGLTEKKRHIVRNLVNSLVPLLFIIAVLKVKINNNSQPQTSGEEEYEVLSQDALGDYFPGERINKIFYSPHTNITENIMEVVRYSLNIVDERVEPFGSEAELEFTLLEYKYLCYGVSFHNVSDDGVLRYTIRTKNNNFRTETVYSRDVFYSYKTRDNEYVESGFLALQNAIDQAYVMLVGHDRKDAPETHVALQYGHILVDSTRGPQEPSRIVLFITILSVGFSSLSTYVLLLPMVEERANGMKEYIKVATAESYWNDAAVFVINFTQFSIVFYVGFAISMFCGIWDMNPAQLIYVFFLGTFVLMNHVAFAFFLSTTLESSAIATAISPIALFGTLILPELGSWLVRPFCIFPVNGLFYGGTILSHFQSSGHVFGASDLFTVGYPGSHTSLFFLCAMQLLGFSLWMFLWFYISNVFPGRYGTPKSKGFFLSRSYWTRKGRTLGGAHKRNKVTTGSQHELHVDMHSTNDLADGFETISLEYINQAVDPEAEQTNATQTLFEAPAKESREVMRISKLYKVFNGRSGTAKVVVKDFSLSIYSHTITVLLGHNGAGKTTTMNIITGVVPRTSGTIIVDGEHNPNRYRHKIGLCPQHNVFFSYLSCQEHVEFFGRLRGLSVDVARAQAKVVLEKVNLLDKGSAFVHTLSGGMQRRLSLANAIIGNTELLILDEPTSGLDPESRRDIWDVLLRLRQNHTILLTTHFMEEADVLGDWVAIMEEGQLMAFGSPLYLKQHYGKGYTLKLLKGPNFDVERTWKWVQNHIPRAAVRQSVQEVFAVTLPYNEIAQYPALLKQLETIQHELGIESIGIANATLEEVFLNSSARKMEFQHHPQSVDDADNTTVQQASERENANTNANARTACETFNIFRAIWQKKWIHMKCYKHVYGCLLALPLLVTACCFLFTGGTADAATALPAVSLRAESIARARGIFVINRSDGADRTVPLLNRDAIQADVAKSPINGVHLTVLEGVSLRDALKQDIDKDYTAYRDQMVVGIEYNVSHDNVQMTVLYNNNLVHSTGIAESVAATLLLRYYSGISEAVVGVQNIPSTRKQLFDVQTPYFFTELISLSVMLYMVVYLHVPLQEHMTGFRQLQNINRYVYWGSTYAFDMAVHVVVCLLVVALVGLLDRENALAASTVWQVLLVLVLYGMLALLVVYIISQCVNNSNTAIVIMSYLMIVGVGGVFLLSSNYDDIKANAGYIVVLHVVPEFALKHSMRVLYENQKLMLYEHLSEKTNRGHAGSHAFANQRIYPTIFYSTACFVLIVLVFILNEIVENIYRREKVVKSRESAGQNIRRMARQVSRTISREGAPARLTLGQDETDSPSREGYDDVDQESEMVKQLIVTPDKEKDYAIVVNGLKKAYMNHEAVKRISFAVKKGECFGLLGMNGAGKTTVFQMLSGNLPLSEGEIYLQHCEVHAANALEYRRQYGYCPQLDVLLDFMTVYEVVDYFARLMNLGSRDDLINSWLAQLDIIEFKNHALRECSGGTKRKVNTILALLGGPSVVLLDEPTTGVDPKSRHFLWKTIKTIQRKNQTIMLTSHSMDECEELCNRLTIMVNGKLRCIGTIPQLKKRYGQGYIYLLKLANVPHDDDGEAEKELVRVVEERLSASLQEKYKALLKFIVSPRLKLSDLFDRAIALKQEREKEILNFSISESSLEDVFLNFRPETKPRY